MTEPASLEALGVFSTYFDESGFWYHQNGDSIRTNLQFGFFGTHDIHIAATSDSIGVRILIVSRVPPGFEETIKRFEAMTNGRVWIAQSGELLWGGLFDPDDFSSTGDVDDFFDQFSYEVSIVEGYLDRYAKDGIEAGDIFLGDPVANSIAYLYTMV